MQKEPGFIALDPEIQTIFIPSSLSSRAVCPSGECNPDIEMARIISAVVTNHARTMLKTHSTACKRHTLIRFQLA